MPWPWVFLSRCIFLPSFIGIRFVPQKPFGWDLITVVMRRIQSWPAAAGKSCIYGNFYEWYEWGIKF